MNKMNESILKLLANFSLSEYTAGKKVNIYVYVYLAPHFQYRHAQIRKKRKTVIKAKQYAKSLNLGIHISRKKK